GPDRHGGREPDGHEKGPVPQGRFRELAAGIRHRSRRGHSRAGHSGSHQRQEVHRRRCDLQRLTLNMVPRREMIEFKEEIERASDYVARDWPGVLEAGDIVQEIWIRLLESPKAEKTLRGADPALRFDVLKRWGHQVASKYANDYELFS